MWGIFVHFAHNSYGSSSRAYSWMSQTERLNIFECYYCMVNSWHVLWWSTGPRRGLIISFHMSSYGSHDCTPNLRQTKSFFFPLSTLHVGRSRDWNARATLSPQFSVCRATLLLGPAVAGLIPFRETYKKELEPRSRSHYYNSTVNALKMHWFGRRWRSGLPRNRRARKVDQVFAREKS